VRVLILDQFAEIGGGQKGLLDILPAMQEAGWEAVVAAPAEGPLSERVRDNGVQFEVLDPGAYSLGRKSIWDSVRFAARHAAIAARIGALADRFRPGLIYVNGPRLLPAVAHSIGARLPVLFHCHHRLTGAAAHAAGFALRRTGASVVSCSRFALEPLLRYVPDKQARVVYNAAPAIQTQARADGDVRIGVVARIDPQKGQDIFLRAAALLPPRRDLRFVICGGTLFGDPAVEAYQRKLHRMARDLRVEFIGHVSDGAAAIAGLDVLAVPSIRLEATTRVILEAFACRVPVVAFATGGIPEVVQHGVNGMLAQEPTAEALAQSLTELLERHDLRSTLAQRAYRDWERNYTLDRYRREVIEIMGERALRGSATSAARF
jgi:glycosyltransferase involved in cell wall biosynthesis